jgi:AcrR family transcriptional regulator
MAVKTRAASTEKRRRKILEAALQCFLERGFAAATAEEIRARSGASIGSIYHHFGGKEGLAGTLHVEGLRDYQAGFLRELRRHRDARSGVQGVVRYHLRWVQAHADWARFLFHLREAEAVQAVKPEIREINHRFAAAVADWVLPHMRNGVITPLPADVIGAVWIGPVQQFARQWLAGHATTTPQQAIRVLADAAWKALRAKAAD